VATRVAMFSRYKFLDLSASHPVATLIWGHMLQGRSLYCAALFPEFSVEWRARNSVRLFCVRRLGVFIKEPFVS